jgi:hypothetical protein
MWPDDPKRIRLHLFTRVGRFCWEVKSLNQTTIMTPLHVVVAAGHECDGLEEEIHESISNKEV